MQIVKKRKGKIRVWIVILLIVGVIALGMAGAVVLTAPGRNELQNMVIADVDFNSCATGFIRVHTAEQRTASETLRLR